MENWETLRSLITGHVYTVFTVKVTIPGSRHRVKLLSAGFTFITSSFCELVMEKQSTSALFDGIMLNVTHLLLLSPKEAHLEFVTLICLFRYARGTGTIVG